MTENNPGLMRETKMDALSVEVLKWAASRGKAYGLTPEDLDEVFMTIARNTYFVRTGGNRLPDSFVLDKSEFATAENNAMSAVLRLL